MCLLVQINVPPCSRAKNTRAWGDVCAEASGRDERTIQQPGRGTSSSVGPGAAVCEAATGMSACGRPPLARIHDWVTEPIGPTTVDALALASSNTAYHVLLPFLRGPRFLGRPQHNPPRRLYRRSRRPKETVSPPPIHPSPLPYPPLQRSSRGSNRHCPTRPVYR